MKKGTKIFILIFLIEIALFLIVSLFMKGTCNYSNPCVVPDFFHPFGKLFSICIQVITPAPCNLGLISLLSWSIIFTALAFIIYLWIDKRKKKK